MWPLGHKLCPTCMIYCPVKSSFCFQSNHFWFEVALGRILSTKWWSLHSAHDKPIILPKQSLTVQFSVFERLQFCCRMLLNVNGEHLGSIQYSQSDHATNSFKNASKTLNGLAIQLQCLYPPQYGWCVWGPNDLRWMSRSKVKDKINCLR